MRGLGVVATSLFALGALGVSGCESHPGPPDAGPSEPSPNASILPAPLATGLDTDSPAGDASPPDAGSVAEAPAPPTPAREDTALAADTEEFHDLGVVTLRARLRWLDVPLPPRLPEMNTDALDRARSAATFDLDVTVAAAGRLRVVLAAPRFVLPPNTEFRARTANYGHVLLWPDGSRYAVVQPGALRNLLNERRADVVPLAHVAATPHGSSVAFGFPVDKVALVTALGRVELEQAHVSAAGGGGALLCRFLAEIAGVHPDSPVCRSDFVPVRAEYAWTDGGRLVFETTALDPSATFDAASLRAPPSTAEHLIGEVPTPPSAILSDRAQLRSLRLRPAATRPSRDAPKSGLLFANGDGVLRYALVDGLPVARLEAKSAPLLLDLTAGNYVVAARTFLGDELTPPVSVSVPGRFVAAEAPRPEP